MATTKSKTAKTTSAKNKAVKFNSSDLPETGTVQYRHGGDYKPAIKALSAFAKGNASAVGHVKALVHLGWVKPGGDNNASKSGAFTVADNAGLSAECWTVGGKAAGQIAANMNALAEAGAPAEALDNLWSAYVGV